LKNIFTILALLIIISSCKKEMSDYYTANDDIRLGTDSSYCTPSALYSRNLTQTEESYTIDYDSIRYGFAKQVLFTSTPMSKNITSIKTKLKDSIYLWNKDTMVVDKITKLVKRMKIMPSSAQGDTLDIRMTYDSNYLSKRLIYLNGDTLPSFESVYTYEANRQLKNIEFRFVPDKSLIYEALFEYDIARVVKPWLYAFTDFFNLPAHLLGFNFGNRPVHLIKKITQTFHSVYESNAIGTQIIDFSRYKLSKDNYVLQYACNGIRLNSTSYFYQNVEINYICK
jgi:hypothetical protein